MSHRGFVRLPILLCAAVLAVTLCSAARADKLLRDYQFKSNPKDSTGVGPLLEPMNGTLNDGNYTFAAGQGLRLEASGVLDHYTIEVQFKFENTDGWQKILDFKRRTSDNGLYVYNGQLQFYNLGIGGEFKPGQEYRVRLERDKNTQKVAGYVNDVVAFEFIDTNRDAVTDTETVYFFTDDTATTGEEAGGVVTRIRVWDVPGNPGAL